MGSNPTRTTTFTMTQATTRTEKIAILKRWMAYTNLSLADLDIGLGSLDEMDYSIFEPDLDDLLEEAEEDRARLIADGCFIREDWTVAK